MFATHSTVFVMLTAAILAVLSIIVYRLAVGIAISRKYQNDPTSTIGQNGATITSLTGAVLNLIAMLILGEIYERLAVKMTDWENHQKESTYQNALTFKMFLFNFINLYASVFYVAFFKGKFAGYPGHVKYLFGYEEESWFVSCISLIYLFNGLIVQC